MVRGSGFKRIYFGILFFFFYFFFLGDPFGIPMGFRARTIKFRGIRGGEGPFFNFGRGALFLEFMGAPGFKKKEGVLIRLILWFSVGEFCFVKYLSGGI